jgi:DNA repair protein RadA
MSCNVITKVSSSQVARCLHKLCEERFNSDLAAMLKLSAMELADLCDTSDVQAVESVYRRILAEMDSVQLVRRGTLKERLAASGERRVLKTRVAEFDEKTPWGGLEFGYTYGFVGEYGAGKTMLAIQVAAYAAAEGYNVKYIHTEGLVPKELFKTITTRAARDVRVNEDDVKARLDIIEVANTTVLKYVIAEIPSNVKVIIVDSIIAPLRAEFQGRENLQPRQQTLNYIIDVLKRHAMTFSALVVVTNQVMDVPDLFSGKRPSGGNVFTHGINRIFMMVKPSKQKPEGYMWPLDVPGMPPDVKMQYRIDNDGLY